MAESQVIGRRRPRLSPATPIRVATLVGLWLLWEGTAASGLLYAGVVPSSFKIAAALARLLASPVFYDNLAFTVMEVVVALVIGGISGAAVGLALGANRFAGAAYERYLHYLAPTPKIVFLPILLVLFGIGAGSKIAMGTLSCFFPVALSVAAGVRTVDTVLLKVGRGYNLTRSQMIRLIYLPSLIPPIASGLRLGLGVAIIGTLLAELKMSNRGLGFLIMQYYSQFRTPEMYAVLIVMFALAAGANALVGRYVRLPGPR
jgi:ABC-type nitrate/sulfonate/bicarbonate transport system permease component